MDNSNFGPNVIYSPSSCIRWWVGVGGEGLDFCKSKQKHAQTTFPNTFHYLPRWGGGGGLDPFDRMLKESLKCWPLINTHYFMIINKLY